MIIIKNSFHINGLEINQRTLCVHVCISAHRNIYTYVDIYMCICVYIYLYKCAYTHIPKYVCVLYVLKKHTPYTSLKEYSENIKMIPAEQRPVEIQVKCLFISSRCDISVILKLSV